MKVINKTNIDHIAKGCESYTVEISEKLSAEVIFDSNEDSLEVVCFFDEKGNLTDESFDEDAIIEFIDNEISKETK
jgi:hypothetical protein